MLNRYTLSGGATSTEHPHNIKFFSWNILYKIRKPSMNKIDYALQKIEKILNFIKDEKADIFFTQESVLTLDEAHSINTNYDVISWDTQSSGISIVYDTTKFIPISDIIRVSINEKPFYLNNIDISKLNIVNDYMDSITKRPILAIKLFHISTKKNILFINLWAAHNIIRNENKNEFLQILEDVIIRLGYKIGDRIIISGDFNEFYEQGNDEVLLLNGINLYLKQREPTCCGQTDITYENLAYRQSNSRFDLIYDSDNHNSIARVSQNRVSDHKPIVYNIEPELNFGHSIHNNRCISPCGTYSYTGLYLRKRLGCASSYCNVRRNGQVVSEKCIPESC